MFKSTKKVLMGIAGLGALALGGAAIAGAAGSSSSGSGTTYRPTAPPGTGARPHAAPATPQFNGPAPGTTAHEDAEKPVTGEAATKAQQAAVKSVGGGGKAGAVTSDLTDTGYEVTVTKSDGSTVDVHLDSSFKALQAPGGHGGHDGLRGPVPGGGPPPAREPGSFSEAPGATGAGAGPVPGAGPARGAGPAPAV